MMIWLNIQFVKIGYQFYCVYNKELKIQRKLLQKNLNKQSFSLGALLLENMMVGAFRSSVVIMEVYLYLYGCNICNRHLISKDLWLDFHKYVPLQKNRHHLRFTSFLTVLFIFMCRNLSPNPACKTTDVENTNRTLTAIPFNVEWTFLKEIFC